MFARLLISFVYAWSAAYKSTAVYKHFPLIDGWNAAVCGCLNYRGAVVVKERICCDHHSENLFSLEKPIGVSDSMYVYCQSFFEIKSTGLSFQFQLFLLLM